MGSSVLVVDDDPDVLAIVGEYLVDLGYTTTTAPNAKAALRALAQSCPNLLLTDIRMPGMDGHALALRAQTDCPAIHVLLMSGWAAEVPLGGMTMLRKPFRMAVLKSAVEGALAIAA